MPNRNSPTIDERTSNSLREIVSHSEYSQSTPTVKFTVLTREYDSIRNNFGTSAFQTHVHTYVSNCGGCQIHSIPSQNTVLRNGTQRFPTATLLALNFLEEQCDNKYTPPWTSWSLYFRRPIQGMFSYPVHSTTSSLIIPSLMSPDQHIL